MSILDLISMPESKTLEFKERMPEPLAIAKTACAFANGGGGTILIGVADKEKTITGIDAQEIHILEEKIANIVYSMVEPTAAVHITIHNLEGKLILKIDVFPGSLKPYHLRNKIIGRIFNEAGLIEGWGTGIRRIRKQIEEKGLVPPEFKENNGFFKTIIYNEPLQKRFEFDEDEKAIIAYIQKHGKASTKELEKVLEKSKATIKRKIRTLTEKRYLVWKGKSKKDPSGYYELTGSTMIQL
jgi:predicted HTH transcriptional regulator